MNLRSVADYRGDEMVQRILALVDQHKPQVSLVDGEPMIRNRKLAKLWPIMSEAGIYTMVVTSGVVPIPEVWTSLLKITITVD